MNRLGLSAMSILASFALALHVSPASAGNSIDITPTHETEWATGEVSRIEYDPNGRLWIWNSHYDPTLGYGTQTHVFTQSIAGDWSHSFRFSPRKWEVADIAFDSSGTLYSTSYGRSSCVIGVAQFANNGTPLTMKRAKLRGGICPVWISISSDDHLFAFSANRRGERVVEFRLPLKKKSKPVRTIQLSLENPRAFTVADDGTIFVLDPAQFLVENLIRVFTPAQNGAVSPDHTIAIDSSYSTWWADDIALTATGDVAMTIPRGYQGNNSAGGIALFSPEQNGTGVIPSTWYPASAFSSGNVEGIAFNSVGEMAVADFGSTTPIKTFFESQCRALVRGC